MKRLIVAVLFFILAIVICITGYIVCVDKLNELNDSLGQAMYVANTENHENLIKLTNNIVDDWDEYEKTLGLFISHSEMEDINSNIKILTFYAKNKDYDQYREYCERSIDSSKNVIDSQNLSLKNIF